MRKTTFAALAIMLGCGTQIALAQGTDGAATTPDATPHKKHHTANPRPALGATRPSNSSGPGIGSGVEGAAGGPGGAGTSGSNDGFGGAAGIGEPTR